MQESYKSFLVINPFGIGDVLFSTPLLRNLKKAYPDSDIFYLCNRRTHILLENNPLIARTFIYERDEFEAEKEKSRFAWFRKYTDFVISIRRKHIDVAIDLSLNSKFGFFCWAAGIRKRIGLDYKKRGRFLTDKFCLKGFDDKHVAAYYLDVLKLIGLNPEECGLEVYLNNKSRQWVKNLLAKESIGHDSLVVGIAPCGGQAFGDKAWTKRWDINRYAELARRLIDKFSAKIFIFAGRGEKKEVLQMLSGIHNRESCYEFTDSSLDKIVALVDRCNLFIGNDTGPLRFADALDKPLIGIFGPVDEKVYGVFPESRRKIIITEDVDCRPCYRRFKLPECKYNRRCLNDISVEKVFNAAETLIDKYVNIH